MKTNGFREPQNGPKFVQYCFSNSNLLRVRSSFQCFVAYANQQCYVWYKEIYLILANGKSFVNPNPLHTLLYKFAEHLAIKRWRLYFIFQEKTLPHLISENFFKFPYWDTIYCVDNQFWFELYAMKCPWIREIAMQSFPDYCDWFHSKCRLFREKNNAQTL